MEGAGRRFGYRGHHSARRTLSLTASTTRSSPRRNRLLQECPTGTLAPPDRRRVRPGDRRSETVKADRSDSKPSSRNICPAQRRHRRRWWKLGMIRRRRRCPERSPRRRIPDTASPPRPSRAGHRRGLRRVCLSARLRSMRRNQRSPRQSSSTKTSISRATLPCRPSFFPCKNFLTSSRDLSGEHDGVNLLIDKRNVTVGKGEMTTTGMKSVKAEAACVGAIDRTRSTLGRPSQSALQCPLQPMLTVEQVTPTAAVQADQILGQIRVNHTAAVDHIAAGPFAKQKGMRKPVANVAKRAVALAAKQFTNDLQGTFAIARQVSSVSMIRVNPADSRGRGEISGRQVRGGERQPRRTRIEDISPTLRRTGRRRTHVGGQNRLQDFHVPRTVLVCRNDTGVELFVDGG